MAKKKKNENLPEGMSRRQAKLAARAAERAALEKDPRPFGGLVAEADLIALQEFVPAAEATVDVKGATRPIKIVTVLPGAVAAVAREDEALVALQTQSHSQNPGRDLAYALNWAKDAAAGESLASAAADGTQPALTELIDASAPLIVTARDEFTWWVGEGETVSPMYAQAIREANERIIPSYPVEANIPGVAWWVNPGNGKAHIRWVRTDDNENQLLNALARIAARGELVLGEGSKFAGAFRTHGVVVPVWDLDPAREVASYAADLEELAAKIDAELGNDAQLTADERKQLQNIKSRQVTI
ncbi:DUF5926 family protein [Corynebacterium renale]|uniref:DUF5926 domain-containing protein n=1 Tax=Corynebacterium renale TaxID=1724 RepID=A0A2A9DME7_9CORY|nr:DUF5926 family protein [Corynebacterium renale]PFG27773.1 hypothetical protein ATK06_0852 [Corynebacterium renale]SQI22112.1 SEC-C domain-containing protein [Corynebacterium renale]